MTDISVNVVVKPGWILEKCARHLEAIPGVALNRTGWPPTAPSGCRIDYFMPEKDLRHMRGPKGIKVGLFTHDFVRMATYAPHFDACVTMNRRAARHLGTLGASRIETIRPGTPASGHRVRFGVCGRVYGKGRKGAHLVEEAVRAGFSFQACAELLPVRRGRPPCRISHAIEDRARFYREVDYLVVTSTDEGGPMTVPEALIHGCAVIAPDVGWSWEYPVIRYRTGDWGSLEAVLRGLTRFEDWADWIERHRALFVRLNEELPG